MKITIVSDDTSFLQQASAHLTRSSYELARLRLAELHGSTKNSAPDLVLFDVGSRSRTVLAEAESLALRHPQVAILLVCEKPSPEFLLDAMRAGVREVVPSLQPKELLAEAVERVAAKRAASRGPATGRIHAFVGSSGGTGTTFLATNFGHQMAQTHKTLLVDLNLQFGDALGFVQEKRAQSTIADLARDLNRLDAALLEGVAVKVSENFSVLAAPNEPAQAADIRAEHVEAILKQAVTQYDAVLIDLPRHLDEIMMAALDLASTTFVVLQASVPQLRNADRLLSILRSLDYSTENVELIVNRYDKRSEVTLEQVQRTLGPFTTHTIANGWRQVSSAINQGVPLVEVERKHGVIRSLVALAAALNPPKEPQLGMVERLFKRA
jgi:pilus assembly protein CpaE